MSDADELPFQLLETLLWQPIGGYLLLEKHLARLLKSAEYFNFHCDRKKVADSLSNAVACCQSPQYVRLCLFSGGQLTIEKRELFSVRGNVLTLSGRVDTRSPFVYHKTTQRAFYQNAQAAVQGASDVILVNSEGHVTECSFSNIVVDKKGRLLTPSAECGLLKGTFRESLLEKGLLEEAIIPAEEFVDMKRIYLINSVRGWMPLKKLEGLFWQVEADFIYRNPVPG